MSLNVRSAKEEREKVKMKIGFHVELVDSIVDSNFENWDFLEVECCRRANLLFDLGDGECKLPGRLLRRCNFLSARI